MISKYADGTENDREAIIKCAKETNICSDISLDENVLRQGVDDIYATTVLDAAQGLFLAYSGEEKNIVEYAEGVINGYEDKSINVDDAGNLTMDSEVKVGDVIALREKDRTTEKFKSTVEATKDRLVPVWLDAKKDDFSATVSRMPSAEDIDYETATHLIVELYSK